MAKEATFWPKNGHGGHLILGLVVEKADISQGFHILKFHRLHALLVLISIFCVHKSDNF